jgi:hypothetical protein
MKIDRLDAHDRFTFMQKDQQALDIGSMCQNIINQRPFGDVPFYIFAHKREIGLDERIKIFEKDLTNFLTNPNHIQKYGTLQNVPTHRLLWQPRLSKPKAETNSMLFKVKPGSDEVRIVWMIPQEELFGQYSKDKMTGNQVVAESIDDYLHNKKKLEAKEKDDVSEEVAKAIYKEIALSKNKPKLVI